jgi:hypothetical protein
MKKFGYEIRNIKSGVRFEKITCEKVLYLRKLYEIIRKEKGDYVECGVGSGRTMLIMTIIMHLFKDQGNLWGFDTFEGIPEPVEKDRSTDKAKIRKAKRGDCFWPYEQVLKNIKGGFKIDSFFDERVKLIKGLFGETLGEYCGEGIKFLHVDCDIYESYKNVLDQLYPLVIPGGVILFDEYGQEKWPGATVAVDEFVNFTGETLMQEEQSGKYYIIKSGKIAGGNNE